ncbi:hypothetical protein NEOC84_000273|nr:Uncharacterized protein [Neochlamydia sp. AcF95]NGY94400.1 hypothetical protein [Neochlamydia sp. AcF84]
MLKEHNFMEPTNVNIWVVLVCTMINNFLASVWYSRKVLGDAWAKEHGFDAELLKPAPWHFIGAFLVAFTLCFVLNMFFHNFAIKGMGNGMAVGFLIWLGFIATTHFSGVIWAKKPFKAYLIDSGYLLLNLILIGAIMGTWQ